MAELSPFEFGTTESVTAMNHLFWEMRMRGVGRKIKAVAVSLRAVPFAGMHQVPGGMLLVHMARGALHGRNHTETGRCDRISKLLEHGHFAFPRPLTDEHCPWSDGAYWVDVMHGVSVAVSGF